MNMIQLFKKLLTKIQKINKFLSWNNIYIYIYVIRETNFIALYLRILSIVLSIENFDDKIVIATC